jgi:GntR family transcriptional repressor for pyruvate dehydrogenase complex
MSPPPTSARKHRSAHDLGDLVDTVLRPVRGHHAFEGCVEQLATAIRLGVFSYGSALPPERELADRLGVSRATLREAIAGLRTAGMVRTTRGRGGGTVVAYRPATPALGGSPGIAERREELLDSLVYRRVVEPGACYVAATRTLTAGDKLLLTTALGEVDQAEDAAAHRQADSRLHLAIASVTGSAMTIEAVTEVQACLHDMLQAIPVLEVNIEHSSRQHRSIVGAILAGDATRARRAMEQHCDDTAALLRGLLG